MRKTLYGVLVVALLLAVGFFLLRWERSPEQVSSAAAELVYPISRTLRYEFVVQNTTNTLLEGATFSAFAPLQQSATQKTVSINASYDFELESDELGNQLMHFTFDALAPYESRVITVNADVRLADEPNAYGTIAPERLPLFLADGEGLETDSQELIVQAQRLDKGDAEQTARAIFDWVHRRLTYTGYAEKNRGALYALRNEKGDCTEFAYLYTALSRINGIPTRIIGGFVTDRNATVRAAGYHNWVEVYVNERWHMVDPQNGVFQDKYQDYIAMRVLAPAMDASGFGADGVASAHKKLNVVMK